MSDPYAQQPRHGDEPPSQPFQPMSYDLSPEYAPPPQQPEQPWPPAHGQQQGGYPPAGYQPQPGYPQPGYQQQQPGYPPQQPAYQPQPSYQPQPGYQQQPPQPGYPGAYAPGPIMPPAPVKKKRRGLLITLSILGALALLCGVGSCVWGYPIISEYGATVTAPDTLPGNLVKSTNTSLQTSTDKVESDIKSSYSADDAVAAFYEDSTDKTKLVLLVAASALILTPGSDIDKALDGVSDSELRIEGVAKYDAGKLGGTVKCGNATGSALQGLTVSACVWTDHGTVGLVFFYSRTVAQSTSLFLQIRESVEHR